MFLNLYWNSVNTHVCQEEAFHCAYHADGVKCTENKCQCEGDSECCDNCSTVEDEIEDLHGTRADSGNE